MRYDGDERSGAAEAIINNKLCNMRIRDPADPTILTDKTRHLGLVVCKGR